MHELDSRVIIRPMTEEDLPQVETIEQESFSMPWSLDAFRSTIRREDTIYLTACRDGEILGYCGMYVSFDGGEIPNVAVHSACRNQGIGEKMLGALLERASDRGVTSVFLEVRESNGAARRLYEKLGFEEAGVRKNFYEKPRENAVILWKK